MSCSSIAVLSSEYSLYQKMIVDALELALQPLPYNLIHISGGALQASRLDDHTSPERSVRNAIFSVARNVDVSGYIILSNAIGHHASIETLRLFSNDFVHKPTVSLGVAIDTLPSVAIDDYHSMVTLMQHMTEDKKRQRFVFIRGYPNHPNSQLREKAFRDTLASRQIPVDETLILDGNFIAEHAYFALDRLLSEDTHIDAVVAANNEMAQSAIHALTHHGMSVPEDVIVSGFDGNGIAEKTLLPVTTVDAMLAQQAEAAVEKIVRLIANPNEIDAQLAPYLINAELIIRTSSGSQVAPHTSDNNDPTIQFQNLRDSIAHNIAQIDAPANLDATDVIDTIMSMFVATSEHLNTWHKQLRFMMYEHPQNIHWWRYLLHSIEKSLAQSDSEIYGFVSVVNAMHIQAQLNSLIWNIEAIRNVSDSQYRNSAARLRLKLSACSTVDQLEHVLTRSLQQSNIQRGFICLFEYSGGHPSERSRLIFQHPPDSIQTNANETFQTSDLLPGDYLKSKLPVGGLIVEPLCVGSTHLGYLVMDRDFGSNPDIVCPADIAIDISNALYRCF